MAKDYIEREALLNALCTDMCEIKYKGVCVHCREAELIRAFPAADVVEVVRGEWVHNDRKEVRCSRCNALFGVGRNLSEIVEDVNFCFNCGADMRGESNG